jgi:hypothetical protein
LSIQSVCRDITTCNRHFGLVDIGETSRRIEKYRGKEYLLLYIEIWINYRKTCSLRFSRSVAEDSSLLGCEAISKMTSYTA